MTEYPAGRGFRPGGLAPRLRLAALIAVIVGVLLLAVAAFLLSYSGIHHIALQAGVTPQLARLYPLIFDAMLVIASAAVLALRGAGWLVRCYVWLCLIVLLAAVATGDAVHAMGITLPRQPSRAGVAVTPWALLLLAFGLLLAMLRHLRRVRASGRAQARAQALGNRDAAGQPARGGHIALLAPRAGEPPALPPAERAPKAQAAESPETARPAATSHPGPAQPHEPAHHQGEEVPATRGYDLARGYPAAAGHPVTEEYLGTDEYAEMADYPETDEYQQPAVHAGSGAAFEAWPGHAKPGDAPQQPDDGRRGDERTGTGQAGSAPDEDGREGEPPSREAGNTEEAGTTEEAQEKREDLAPAPQFDRLRSTPTRPEQ